MRKSISWLVSIGACVMFLALGVCTVKNVQAETETYEFSVYHCDLNNIKAPEKDGYVFAGWYDAEGNHAPKNATQGDYIAKFVDDDVLKVIWQLTKDTTKESQSTHLRLITSVDTLKYAQVGFDINGHEEMARDVYDMIVADGEPYDPKSKFHNDSEWFATFVLANATNDLAKADGTELFGATFRVTPQWVTLDGTLVKGKTRDICINDELGYEAKIESLTNGTYTEETVWYDTLSEAVSVAASASEDATVTVLQNVALNSILSITANNVTIQNQPGKDITISRGTDLTGKFLYCSSTRTIRLMRPEGDTEGGLTIDAKTTEASTDTVIQVGNSTGSGTKFYLGDGVTIMNANSSNVGAALRINTWAELRGDIKDNTATHASGGVLYVAGTVTIAGGTYSGNEGVNGGAVYVANTGNLTISSGVFKKNHAQKGGVIYAGSTTTISSATFEENYATGSTGGGGGVVLCNATVTINSGTFIGNNTTHSSAYGGVARVDGGTLTIKGGTFNSNNSCRGGVVYTAKKTTITGGTFEGNYSLGGLGGSVLCSNNGEIEVLGTSKVVFKNNYVNSAANNAGGGAIHLINSGKLTLQNCEFTNNLHVGGTAGTGTDGCDIAFVRDANHEFALKDKSFDGVVRITDEHTTATFNVKDTDSIWTLSNVTKGFYSVDYTEKNLVPVSTTN